MTCLLCLHTRAKTEKTKEIHHSRQKKIFVETQDKSKEKYTADREKKEKEKETGNIEDKIRDEDQGTHKSGAANAANCCDGIFYLTMNNSSSRLSISSTNKVTKSCKPEKCSGRDGAVDREGDAKKS